MSDNPDSVAQRQLLESIISRHRDYYLVIDCETTGPARDWDLAYELGYCLMDRGECVTSGEIVLNWADHPHVNTDWLRNRMKRVRESMAARGGTYTGSIRRLREEGIKPEKGLYQYLKLLRQVRRGNGFFVGHNAWSFDISFLQNHFEEYLGKKFRFKSGEVMDTGAIEKGASIGVFPEEGQTPKDYFLKVCRANVPGVHWSLTHCVEKYGLDLRYNLDLSKAHGAGFDAEATAILFEEFRAGDNCVATQNA